MNDKKRAAFTDTEPPNTFADTLLSHHPPETPRAGAYPGLTLSGKYHLISVLGAGGMGEVYRGEHLTLGIPIAVKILHQHIASNPNHLRRFRREAHAVSKLHHPNVVRVLDFDEDPGQGVNYLVMEFLEGEPANVWLAAQEEPPPLAEVAELMRQLFDAFEVAHALGIIHRDLKPENMFLTRTSDGKRTLKLVDFGLAHVDDTRDREPTLTQTDIIAGTPAYMSPEQSRSLAVGPSSDLYAIGCVLTDLLQLRPPFEGKNAIEILTKQMFMTPPPLDRPANAEPVPPLLERLRLDLLAKSPEKRPRDVSEARARLLEAMSPEATAARLPDRKADPLLGGRSERLPDWGLGPKPKPLSPSSTTREVGLVRLETTEQGVDSLCILGLAAQGIMVTELKDGGIPGGAGPALILLDAGNEGEGALAHLARIAKAGSPPRTIVCAREISAEQMNQLIAAGATDVAIYPVTPSSLAKKIDRALKRWRL